MGQTRVKLPCEDEGGVNRATPLPTGQTTSYRSGDDGDLQRGRGADFLNLDAGDTNFFGNEKRFTGITGGFWDEGTSQYKDVSGTVVAKSVAFPSNIVLDWQSYNQATGDVIWWCINPTTSTNWNDAIDGQPYSNYAGLGYNDWYLPNRKEMDTIVTYEQLLILDYSPFELDTSLSYNWLFTSSTYIANTANAFVVMNVGTIAANAKTNLRSFIVLRYGNISEL